MSETESNTSEDEGNKIDCCGEIERMTDSSAEIAEITASSDGSEIEELLICSGF